MAGTVRSTLARTVPPAAPDEGAPAGVPVGFDPPVGLVLALLAVHVPLAFGMRGSAILSTAHAALTIGVVAWAALLGRNPSSALAAAAYATGSEVLWRQTGAHVPWEISKYLLLGIFAVTIARFFGRPRRVGVPLLFLAVLLPACVIPVVRLGIVSAFEPISFNLAASAALGVGAILCSRLAGTWASVRGVLWALVAPAIGTAALATSFAVDLQAADFIDESNLLASGGYGPNQVSAILGLGALFCLLLAVREPHWLLRGAAVGLAMWFVGQALVTFSRGGVVNLIVALIVATPHLLLRRSTAARFLGILLIIALVGSLAVLPRLERYTGGRLADRFTAAERADIRSALAGDDLSVFARHPLIGAGVGQAESERTERVTVAAHTEYTRLLAEHGVFGMVAILCLAAMAIQAYRRQQDMWGRAWTAALVAWTAAELAHSAGRLAAVPFAFALGLVLLVPDDRAPALSGSGT